MVDDYSASVATTGIVAVGGSITGSIETTGDVDWIRVSLIAGTTYRFEAAGLGSGEGTLSVSYFGLLDGSGHALTPFVYSGGPPGGGRIRHTLLCPAATILSLRSLSGNIKRDYKVFGA